MPKRPRTSRTAGGRAGNAARAAGATAAATAVAAGASVPPLAPGEVAVHEGLALIEVADPADLAALLADPRLGEFVLARIGERAAVALPQVAPRLLLAMAKAGHIATIEGEP
ncbi:MAG: hypothetical protein K0A98_09780 [Trueperaceae bacterium]|nr:hypothetical protein [Trueperaceae bacterium]